MVLDDVRSGGLGQVVPDVSKGDLGFTDEVAACAVDSGKVAGVGVVALDAVLQVPQVDVALVASIGLDVDEALGHGVGLVPTDSLRARHGGWVGWCRLERKVGLFLGLLDVGLGLLRE